tara:strand:+ start:1622 stop:2902 length:1281 start_codon:yes stop_codon:yes gene_type:complete
MLAGELGEKYGAQHEYYNLQTPADAIKLLCINYPALRQELLQAHNNGVGYRVIQGGSSMGYDELHLPFGSKPLMVVPVITGSGGDSPVGQILLGVGLVAAAIVFAPAGAGFLGLGAGATAGTFTLGAAASSAIGAIGASLILSGTASLISPQPELAGARIKGSGTNSRGSGPEGVTRGASGKESYAFNGPVNTVGTGATVPLIYGEVITGSHLLAANLDISDDSDPLLTSIQTPRLETLTVNGDKLTRKLKSCGGLDSRRGVERLNSSNSARRIVINRTFGPRVSDNVKLKVGEEIDSNSSSAGFSALEYKRSQDKRKRLDVIFQVNGGLFDNVSGVKSTKIDGFITYEITCTVTTGGADVDVAKARATVQGLVNPSQNFRYGHRLEMPRLGDRSGEDLDIKVEIVDLGVHPDVHLTLHAYGYNLL